MRSGLSERTQHTQTGVRVQIMMVATDIPAINCYLRKKPEECQIPRESERRDGLTTHKLCPEIVCGGDAPFVSKLRRKKLFF